MFQMFGSLIVELEIEFRTRYPPQNQNFDFIMDTLVFYCTAVESLTLKNFDIPDNEEALLGMRKLFARVQKLCLNCVCIETSGYEEMEIRLTFSSTVHR